MKKNIISLLLAAGFLSHNSTAAVISTATVITGKTTSTTQIEVINSSPLAGTVNLSIQPGGIVSNSKWNLLLHSDEDILSIDGITIQLNGPTGAVSNLFVVGLVYSMVGSPTVGAYSSIGENVTSANGQSVYGHLFSDVDDTKTIVIADATFANNFGGGLYNPTALGETLTMTWTVNGQNTSGAFTSQATSIITVAPEPSSGILAMISALGLTFVRRRG